MWFEHCKYKSDTLVLLAFSNNLIAKSNFLKLSRNLKFFLAINEGSNWVYWIQKNFLLYKNVLNQYEFKI
jgi:hypothetical protein